LGELIKEMLELAPYGKVAALFHARSGERSQLCALSLHRKRRTGEAGFAIPVLQVYENVFWSSFV
jgi:hypothetical protein